MTGIVSDVFDVELRSYLALALLPRTSNPSEWWIREGKQRYPLLFYRAVKYLSIPATSVPSGTSGTGCSSALERNCQRRDDDHASMLIYLHGKLEENVIVSQLIKEMLQ